MVGSDLVTELQEEVGGALRSVGWYHDSEHERAYRRDDIAASYSIDEVREIFADLAIQGLSREYLEELFHAGRFECSMFHFEEALMFHFVAADDRGLFVSVDTGTGLDIKAIVDLCKSHL